MTRTTCAIALLLASAACASHPPTITTNPAPAATPTSESAAATGEVTQAGAAQPLPEVVTSGSARKSSTTINEMELSDPSLATSDVYSAIQKLRPAFFTTRGSVSLRGGAGGIAVSVNDGPLTGLDALRSMRVNEVRELKYLAPNEAAQRFGTKAGNGAVIMVRRK